jgi:hypothetical protein
MRRFLYCFTAFGRMPNALSICQLRSRFIYLRISPKDDFVNFAEIKNVTLDPSWSASLISPSVLR